MAVSPPTGDDDDPTRAFLSLIWQQVGDLAFLSRDTLFAITFPRGTSYDIINAGAEHTGQLVPQSDAWLHGKGGDTVSVAQRYYRALGRVMVYCMRHGYHIAAHVLPDFYRNYLIRNMHPLSEDYDLNDLVGHVASLINSNITEEEEENKKLIRDFDGPDISPEVFRQAVHKRFIDGYQVALKAFREGITLKGEQT
jgi:hypothetical protein